MLQQLNLSEFAPQSIRCLKILGESYHFFMTHKLWKGIFQHKWILLITVILSILFTVTLFSNLYDIIFSVTENNELGLINNEESSKTAKTNKNTAIFGGSRFLFLIMLEIVIFHFSVKTLEILNNEKYKTTFGMFLSAEIRMVRVMIRGAIQSLIAQIVLGIVLSILDFDFILPILMFLVHSFFIGLAFLDNYNEQQKLNVKESDICIRHHSGAATTLGVVASLGLMIPFIGPLAVPVFGAITANIYGSRYHIENPTGHREAETPTAEERQNEVV